MPMRIIEREVDRSLKQPVSVRAAMGVIVSTTFLTVIAAGFLIRLLDPEGFPNVGVGMWWALQTVTTVGYGDVTPKTPFGRIVGAVIMIEAIAFLTVITAAVTSSFVERVRRKYRALEVAEDAAGMQRLEARLDLIVAQLEGIERALDDIRSRSNPAR
jgi:voltage-gated potassium channel Kch